MAIEKGLVLAAIELKLKGKSASKNFKENIAAKWAEKIETDADLDSFIEDREDVLLEACSEADRRATAATAKAKEEAGKPNSPVKEDEKPAIPDDAPEWAKALIKQNETMSAKLDTFESKQKTQSIAERFNSDERTKGIPDIIRRSFLPKSDDDFETQVEALVTEYKPFAEKHKLAAFGKDTPGSGTDTKGAETKPVSDDKAKDMAAILTGTN